MSYSMSEEVRKKLNGSSAPFGDWEKMTDEEKHLYKVFCEDESNRITPWGLTKEQEESISDWIAEAYSIGWHLASGHFHREDTSYEEDAISPALLELLKSYREATSFLRQRYVELLGRIIAYKRDNGEYPDPIDVIDAWAKFESWNCSSVGKKVVHVDSTRWEEFCRG